MIAQYLREQSGVAATEFALIAPVLLFLLIGLFDYGTFMNQQMKLENTSRAAAQYLVLGGDEDALVDEILVPSDLELTADDMTVTYIYECAGGVAANENTDCGDDDYLRQYVQVTLIKNYEAVMSWAGLLDNLTLRGQVRLQNQ